MRYTPSTIALIVTLVLLGLLLLVVPIPLLAPATAIAAFVTALLLILEK